MFGLTNAPPPSKQILQPRGLPRQPRPHIEQPGQPVFPDCAERVLNSIIGFVNSNIDPKFRRSKTVELQHRLDTDLFGLNSMDSRSSALEPMQRLKLLNLLCNFYTALSKRKETAKSYEYFNLIFCGREGSGPSHEHRISTLSNLCAMAIQFPCYTLFEDIATWFMKIQSKVYAKRIVNDLVEAFVLAPEKYELSKDLYPLQSSAFEFSCFFVVYSINKKTLSPQLVSILGEWMTKEPIKTLSFISDNPTLRSHFKNECIQPMIIYDSKQSLNDEIHDRFHCSITQILLLWRKLNGNNGDEVRNFDLETTLGELIATSDSIRDEFKMIRLAQNVENAYRAGHYPKEKLIQCIQNTEECVLVKKGYLNQLLD